MSMVKNVMNLLAAPADISSKDVPLREDIRLLGRILGDTLREQEGVETFELVETVRRAAVRFRKTQDERDRLDLEQMLDALSPLGVRSLEMPLKSERIWRAIHEAKQEALSPR